MIKQDVQGEEPKEYDILWEENDEQTFEWFIDTNENWIMHNIHVKLDDNTNMTGNVLFMLETAEFVFRDFDNKWYHGNLSAMRTYRKSMYKAYMTYSELHQQQKTYFKKVLNKK